MIIVNVILYVLSEWYSYLSYNFLFYCYYYYYYYYYDDDDDDDDDD